MEWLIEPLIGCVIGSFTNYIAIKMLFRPYTKKTIFGVSVPFTPGIIPKRKSEIAKSISRVISKDLLDEKSLAAALCSDKVTESLVTKIMNITVNTEGKAGDLANRVGTGVADLVANSDIETMVAKECFTNLKEKLSSNFLGKLVPDDMLKELSTTVGQMVQKYFRDNGKTMIASKISSELTAISGNTVEEILQQYMDDTTVARFKLADIYVDYVRTNIGSMLKLIDIEDLIIQKIESMNMRELETLVVSVMKKELNAIVYLGALIGLVLGILNIFI